jgi:hypothetical protein
VVYAIHLLVLIYYRQKDKSTIMAFSRLINTCFEQISNSFDPCRQSVKFLPIIFCPTYGIIFHRVHDHHEIMSPLKWGGSRYLGPCLHEEELWLPCVQVTQDLAFIFHVSIRNTIRIVRIKQKTHGPNRSPEEPWPI